MDHSLLIALFSVAMETEFVIQLPPSITSVFAVIKAEAPLARKSTLHLPQLGEKRVFVKVHSHRFDERYLPPVKMCYSYSFLQT